MWPVALAVVGAWCIAAGAAAQEQPATAEEGKAVAGWGLLARLVRRPRWIGGGVLIVAGSALHVIALSLAPLTVVQPLGVSGLLLAVWLSARWRGRRLRRREWLGAAAVTFGLAGLVLTLPQQTQPLAAASDGMALLCLAGLAAAGAAWGAATRLSPRHRAWTLAVSAGLCFGVGSALARVVGSRMHLDLGEGLHWATAAVVVLVAAGALLTQNAFRSGHFGLAYAVLLIADPAVASTVGMVVLGEPLPQHPAAVAGAWIAAAVTAVGVVALSRNPPAGATTVMPSHEIDQFLKENQRVHIDAGASRS